MSHTSNLSSTAKNTSTMAIAESKSKINSVNFQPTTEQIIQKILSVLSSKLLDDYKEIEVIRGFNTELIEEVPLLPELWAIVTSYLGEKEFFLQLLKYQVIQDSNLRNRLWQIVYNSREDKCSTILAANAITLLNAIGVSFNGLDLHGIKIAGANLSGAQLDSTNLQGADLREVNFSYACLRKCNLEHAQLDHIKLEELLKIRLNKAAMNCVYSQDLRYLVVAVDCAIYLYNGLTRELLHVFEQSSADDINGVAIDDGKFLASGGYDGALTLWDIEQKQRVIAFKVGGIVTSVAFGPNGRLAWGCNNGQIYLFDLKQLEQEQKLAKSFNAHDGCVNSIVFGPGEQLISAGSDKIVHVLDIKREETAHSFAGHKGYVLSVALGQENLLASGSRDKNIHIWDLQKKELVCTLEGHTGDVASVVFIGPRLLASGSDDKTIRIWDIQQKQCLYILKGHSKMVSGIALGREGILASASFDKTVRFWDTKQKALMHPIVTGQVRAVNLSAVNIAGATGLDAGTYRLFKKHKAEGTPASSSSMFFAPTTASGRLLSDSKSSFVSSSSSSSVITDHKRLRVDGGI